MIYLDQSGLKNGLKKNCLTINNCGKLIIPQRINLDPQLDTLFARAIENDAKVEMIDDSEIKKLVPQANITSGRAIWS